MPHLSANDPFRMVFEHLQDYFHPKDSTSEFPQLFQFYFHITQGHISHQITHVFGVAYFLIMTKPSNEICPIAMGEMLYRFISYTLCFQFHDTFTTY
jgi:hypothetical protein